ncbi:hypothetical protein BSLG_003764 [Batrachochytrium salamandrivorans]|nr:hypothetical protein BSLG_003764 [Batrachochytrium salamandrivorans]
MDDLPVALNATFSPTQGSMRTRQSKWRMLSRKLTPADTDRVVTSRLRCPTPLSEAFAAKMKLSAQKIAEIRSQEATQCEFINFINQYYPSHVSPGALQTNDVPVFHVVGDEEHAANVATMDDMVSSYESFKKAGF